MHIFCDIYFDFLLDHSGRSVYAVAQSVERATPGEEVVCSIPTVARTLLVRSVSV